MDMTPLNARDARMSVMLTATVFRMGGAEPTHHRVVNLSASGACIAQPGEIATGTAVIVSVGRAAHMPAEVVWVRASLAGLRFHERIDVAAARQRRTDKALPPPAAGWLAELNSPYRR